MSLLGEEGALESKRQGYAKKCQTSTCHLLQNAKALNSPSVHAMIPALAGS